MEVENLGDLGGELRKILRWILEKEGDGVR
jgi:hypothetical protein